MRAELRREAAAPVWVSSVETTGSPEHYMAPTPCATTPTVPARPLAGTAAPAPEVTGRVRVPVLNVRSAPWSGNNRIGLVHAGDVLTIVGGCEDWYRVQLAETQTATSKIKGGEGWVARVVVSAPRQAVPPAQAAPQP